MKDYRKLSIASITFKIMGNFNSLVFPAPEDLKAFELYPELQLCVPKKDKKEFIPCFWIRQSSKKAILFFHGNAEDIGSSLELISEISSDNNANLIIMEYPGYGSYKGSPSAGQILEDAQSVYSYMVNELQFEESNIVVFGRSLGSGPATHLASTNNPKGLILFSPYTSIKDVASNMVGSFLASFVRNRFKNIEKISNVRCKILFIHGKSDNLIPYSHSENLGKRSLLKPDFVFPDKMTHNDFRLNEDVLKPIRNYFEAISF